MIRVLVALLLGVLLAVVGLGALETHRGEGALRDAEAARAAGNWPAAITAAKVAAEARVPYTHHASAALDLLERIASEAEAAREADSAALARRIAVPIADADGDGDRAARLRSQEKSGSETNPNLPRGGRGARSSVAVALAALGILVVAAGVLLLRSGKRSGWLYALTAAGSALLLCARLLA